VPMLRYSDLALLALALPIFVIADLPMAGYVVAAAAWLVARGIGVAADRRVARTLAEGRRNAAMGTFAAAMLGRIWLLVLAILLVGLLAERDSGLAAAVLVTILFTVQLANRGLERLLEPGDQPR
jgi:hypothetical protein